MVLHQKQHLRKIDSDKTKTKKTIKKRIKNRHGNKTPKRHHAGPIFLLFWTQKSPKMKSRALQKTSFEKHLKKRATKITTLPFQGHFWGGSGGAGDTHFSSYFQPSTALGTKMAPRAPTPPGPAGPRFLMILALFLCFWGPCFISYFCVVFLIF